MFECTTPTKDNNQRKIEAIYSLQIVLLKTGKHRLDTEIAMMYRSTAIFSHDLVVYVKREKNY